MIEYNFEKSDDSFIDPKGKFILWDFEVEGIREHIFIAEGEEESFLEFI